MAWKTTALVAGAAAVAFVAGRAATGNGGGQPPAPPGDAGMPPEVAAMMAKMQPGEHHKRLDAMVGRWEGAVKFRMSPEEPWTETKGAADRKWDLDGRFLIENVTGDAFAPGMPAFKGIGILGYNTFENKYESVWIENMATYMSIMTGTYDAAKKTLTFTGEVLDPMSGKRLKQRHVMDLSDPNKQKGVGYCTGADGKEFQTFEGTFLKK